MADQETDVGLATNKITMFRTAPLLITTLSLALCATLTAQRSPDEALRALQEGNRRFADDRSVPQPIGPGVRHTLARGQSPFAIVVTCADSRVPPEHLFNTGLGELIVVRTAGHVLGPEAIATIEQAVEQLNVPLCVVLGHEHCDVVAAAIQQATEHGHQSHLSPSIIQLLERIEPAVRKARTLDVGGKQMQGMCEEEHAHITVAESMGRSPLLRRYASVGKFLMVPARYHAGGEVEFLPNRPLPTQPEAHRSILTGTVPPGLPPHVALRMLRAGHRRFLGDARPAPDLTKERRAQLTEGQQPLAIVVTDSDSRVSPEHIFDAGIGELFVIRIAGNTMTDETLGSIEFAAGQLGASLLVVMGHNRCQAIVQAADHPEKKQLTPHQRRLLRQLEPSVSAAREHRASNLVAKATEGNVLRAVAEARSRSTLLRTLEAEGRFSILATTYDVASGDLNWLKVPQPEMVMEPTASHGDKHAPSHVASAHGADPHAADSHGKAAHGGETHGNAPHADAHSKNAHGTDAHRASSHGVAGNDHGSAAHGAHDSHALDDLPLMQFPAPGGESRQPHGSGHAEAHGNTHDNSHGDAHHGTEKASHGNAHEPSHQESGHANHDGVDHSDHGDGHSDHGQSHGNGHGADSHGDHHGDQRTSEWLTFLKDPIVIVGLTGITSLLAAAILVLRRR